MKGDDRVSCSDAGERRGQSCVDWRAELYAVLHCACVQAGGVRGQGVEI